MDSQDGKGHDAMVIAKFFNPYGRGPWDTLYITEFDGEDTLFGYCISNVGDAFDEWGYSQPATRSPRPPSPRECP